MHEENELYPIVLEGFISIEAVLRTESRKIARILIDRDKKPSDTLSRLRRMAERKSIPLDYADAREIETHTRGKTGGGVIAFAAERQYLSPRGLLSGGKGMFACLEGFEDPFNYGYAMRALYAAGFSGVLTARPHWNDADGVFIKASAGASEAMPTARFEDYEALVAILREYGCQLVCAEHSARAQGLYEADFRSPALIVIGGEKRGISKTLLRGADLHVRIPYARAYPYALPGVAAASVIGFEIMRRGLTGFSAPG